MRCIEITTSLPPSVNARYDVFISAQRGRKRRVQLNDRTTAYQDAIGWDALAIARALPEWPAPPFRLDVWLHIAPAQASVEPDADNALKAICDGLMHALSRDGQKANDRDILEIHVFKRRHAPRSTCRIRLSWGEGALTETA